jgi:hypothetical protein
VHLGPTTGDGTGKILEDCARKSSRHRIDRPRAELRELAADLRIVVDDQTAGSTRRRVLHLLRRRVASASLRPIAASRSVVLATVGSQGVMAGIPTTKIVITKFSKRAFIAEISKSPEEETARRRFI